MTQAQLNDKFLHDMTNYFLRGNILNAAQAKQIKKDFYTVKVPTMDWAPDISVVVSVLDREGVVPGTVR